MWCCHVGFSYLDLLNTFLSAPLLKRRRAMELSIVPFSFEMARACFKSPFFSPCPLSSPSSLLRTSVDFRGVQRRSVHLGKLQGLFWVLIFLFIFVYALAVVLTRIVGHVPPAEQEAPAVQEAWGKVRFNQPRVALKRTKNTPTKTAKPARTERVCIFGGGIWGWLKGKPKGTPYFFGRFLF